MLAYCLFDGLTCSMKVYRRGDIFVLPKGMEASFGGLSLSELVTKQRKIYRKEMFRWPTNEEVVEAYRGGDVSINDCSPKEKLLVADKRGDDGVRLQEAAKVLRDNVVKNHPELAEVEEEVEPIEDVPSVTKYPKPVAPKKSVSRKTKKE